MALNDITTPDVGGASDVIEILVKIGDVVSSDTPVITLESDKATMEVPAGIAGIVKKIIVKIGDKVSVGDKLIQLETEAGAAEKEKKAPSAAEKKSSQQTKIVETALSQDEEDEDDDEDVSTPLQGTITTSQDVHAGPGVRRFARELGVDLTAISGSGPKQRILKEDVQQFVKQQLSQRNQAVAAPNAFSLPAFPSVDFSAYGETQLIPLTRIKKISGKLLQRNAMLIPHVTQFGEADVTDMETYRVAQKAQLEAEKVKLTPLVFVMKAVVAALKRFPTFNASLDPQGENLIMKHYYHIGVAVDTPEGLVVPVIRDVDKKGLKVLAVELAEVSERARKQSLLPKDMQGGCFSISSLGGIGGTAFTPIINSPEVAILGVSKAQHKPVYVDGDFEARLMLPLSLSYDHRVIDGAEGARFMVHLAGLLSDIRHLLM